MLINNKKHQKNILIVCTEMKPGGGPGGYTYNLMRAYLAQKAPSDVFRLEFSGAINESRNGYVAGPSSESKKAKIFDNKAWNKFREFCARFAKLMPWILSIFRAEMVVFQGFQGADFLRIAKLLGKKIVYMPHSPSVMADEAAMYAQMSGGTFTEEQYQQIFRAEKRFFAWAHRVVFPSEGASLEYRKVFSDLLPDGKVVYIESGIFPGSRPESSVKLDGEYKVLFAGRYVPHKGFDLYCAAAEIVAKERRNVNFYSVGGGAPVNGGTVVDLGWKSNIYEYLVAADLIVIPNRIAYYDLLPLECAFLGKPMVMTAVGGNVDQMKLLPDTISAESATPDSIANAISRGLEECAGSPRYGDSNRAAFEEKFSMAAFWERWRTFIEREIQYED